MNTRILALSLALISGAASWSTFADAATCTNDTDCTANGMACGTDVCSWNQSPHTCVPAGTDKGWCGTDSTGGTLSQDDADKTCKCHGFGLGATCVSNYCTITQTPDAGASAATDSGSGSTSSNDGSVASDTGTDASSGTSGSASGSTSDAAPTEAGSGSTSGTTTAEAGPAAGGGGDSSGCNMGRSSTSPWGIGLLALGVCVALRRRRG